MIREHRQHFSSLFPKSATRERPKWTLVISVIVRAICTAHSLCRPLCARNTLLLWLLGSCERGGGYLRRSSSQSQRRAGEGGRRGGVRQGGRGGGPRAGRR